MEATLETESLLTEPELALAFRAAVWVALDTASGIRTGWGLGSGALGREQHSRRRGRTCGRSSLGAALLEEPTML